eukprot:g2375.t1
MFHLRDYVVRIDTPSNWTEEEGSVRATLDPSPRVVFDDAHLAVLFKPRGIETKDFAHDTDSMTAVGRTLRIQRKVKNRERARQLKKERKEGLKMNHGAADTVGCAGSGVPLHRPQVMDTSTSQHHQQRSVLARVEAEDQHHGSWQVEDFDHLATPEPVHRLDKDTGGLLLFAKHKAAKQELCRLFRERKIQKRYRAVVRGWVGAHGDKDHLRTSSSSAVNYLDRTMEQAVINSVRRLAPDDGAASWASEKNVAVRRAVGLPAPSPGPGDWTPEDCMGAALATCAFSPWACDFGILSGKQKRQALELMRATLEI